MMIAERQNREKNIPRRRKKEKIITMQNNLNDEDIDINNDELDEDEINNEKDNINDAIVETNEALTVNKKKTKFKFLIL